MHKALVFMLMSFAFGQVVYMACLSIGIPTDTAARLAVSLVVTVIVFAMFVLEVKRTHGHLDK